MAEPRGITPNQATNVALVIAIMAFLFALATLYIAYTSKNDSKDRLDKLESDAIKRDEAIISINAVLSQMLIEQPPLQNPELIAS